MLTVTIEQIIKDIDRFSISVDFRDQEWTLLVEILLENLEDHGKIKKINNYKYGANVIFSQSSKTIEVDHDDRDRFESLIDDCVEYQRQNKLNQLSADEIINIFEADYDELD